MEGVLQPLGSKTPGWLGSGTLVELSFRSVRRLYLISGTLFAEINAAHSMAQRPLLSNESSSQQSQGRIRGTSADND